MRLRFLVALACFGPVFSVPAYAQSPDGAVEMVAGALHGYIQPAYRAFATAADALHERVETLCQEPSAETLEAARAGFDEAVQAWAGIELVRFGPVTQDNRLERIFYWPDRRSIGLKQVQGILATEDASATSLDTLVQKSVAVQGFGALEFSLFGTGSDDLADQAGFRCDYARTVTANLDETASQLSAGWTDDDGISRLWTEPGADNPLYRSGEESLSDLIDIAIHGLELVRDVRINGFLAEVPGDDQPKQALFWRSRQTIPAIRSNLRSVGGLLDAAGLEEHLAEDKRWIPDSIRFELANADRALAALDDDPIADILADPDRRAKLDYVRIVTSGLSDLVGRQLSGEYGLTAGFSSLDGD
ncbi:imelysin family protein [Aquibium oceanicum]|uniref:Peptidase M75, Imelysin n=1 Tax=Aquibium oceanicum TaxID=1670800 RepID=A0A1L3SMB5_9HYPH|nr:imelysin family protein [Aquibium oceanicum]APH70534.1 peptidase M75, Imelysin [Aquibium oceanicum]